MKYKKNKLRLNKIASEMQGSYFLVKFGWILIYILKAYLQKPSSILLRKNILNSSLLAFFFWKVCTFSSVERFRCWKPRNSGADAGGCHCCQCSTPKWLALISRFEFSFLKTCEQVSQTWPKAGVGDTGASETLGWKIQFFLSRF